MALHKSIMRESRKNCTCGGEAIIEHEGTNHFACRVEFAYQTKEIFVEASVVEAAWNNDKTDKKY